MANQNDSMNGWIRIALRMTPKQRDLLLVGKCAECRNDAARMIESS